MNVWETRLRKLRATSNGWYSCECPRPEHDDSDPSCGFHPEKGFHCHACGWKSSIVEACGAFGWEIPEGVRSVQDSNGVGPSQPLPVAIYDYHDESGKVVARVKRFEPSGRKKYFTQHSLVDGRWEDRRAFKFPPYGIPKLLSSQDSVFWVEGEKCADYLNSLGLTSITTSGGSNGLPNSNLGVLKRLRGRTVFILRDYDDAGLRYAQLVSRELSRAGVIGILLELPGDLSDGDDVIDWMLGKGGSKERLLDISERAQSGSKDSLALSSLLSEMAERLAEGGDAGELRGELLRRVSSLGNNREARIVTASEAIEEFAKDLETGKSEDRIRLGWKSVDSALDGIERQELIFLGGDPGFGKTAFAVQAAVHVANLFGDVLVISQEMSSKQIGKRICALEYEKSPRKMTPHEARQVAKICSELPLRILDGRLDVDSLEMECRRWASASKSPRLLVVDYLQLVSRGSMPETEFIAMLTPRLKALCKELEVPMLCLAQGSRGQRAMPEPTKSYFRGSSAIESDADRALILWEDVDEPVKPGEYDVMARPVSLYFVKQREGPSTRVRLTYAEPLTKFSERVLTTAKASAKITLRQEPRFEEVQF